MSDRSSTAEDRARALAVAVLQATPACRALGADARESVTQAVATEALRAAERTAEAEVPF